MNHRKPYSDNEAIEPWEIESLTASERKNKGYQRRSLCSGMPLYLSVFTIIFVLLAFVAFDQGIVNISESAEPGPASVLKKPMSLKSWDKKEIEIEELLSKKKTAWEKAMLEADEILSKSNYSEASCLVANTARTATLVKDVKANPRKTKSNTATKTGSAASLLPLPVLNLGMPKCGTTSQWGFFKCAGYKATHTVEGDFNPGLCMRDAARVGLPPLANCAKGDDSLTELDSSGAFGEEYQLKKFYTPKSRDDCFYPQLSLLEELHEDDPNATFLLAFRPVDDWIDSVTNWLGEKITELQRCNFPNMPRGIPNVRDPKDVHDQSVRFICSHVIHVRNFVEAHPSHALVEYDLYDNDANSEVLGNLFPYTKDNTNSGECWGHVSHGKDLHKGDKGAWEVERIGDKGNGQQKGGQGNGQQIGGNGNGQQNGGNGNGQQKGGQGNGQRNGDQGNGQQKKQFNGQENGGNGNGQQKKQFNGQENGGNDIGQQKKQSDGQQNGGNGNEQQKVDQANGQQKGGQGNGQQSGGNGNGQQKKQFNGQENGGNGNGQQKGGQGNGQQKNQSDRQQNGGSGNEQQTVDQGNGQQKGGQGNGQQSGGNSNGQQKKQSNGQTNGGNNNGQQNGDQGNGQQKKESNGQQN